MNTKYQEGIGYRALLNGHWKIKFQRHSVRILSEGWLHFEPAECTNLDVINDFVFIRTVHFDGEFDFKNDSKAFQKKMWSCAFGF